MKEVLELAISLGWPPTCFITLDEALGDGSGSAAAALYNGMVCDVPVLSCSSCLLP